MITGNGTHVDKQGEAVRKQLINRIKKWGSSSRDMLLRFLLADAAVCAFGMGLAVAGAIAACPVTGVGYLPILLAPAALGILLGRGLGRLYGQLGFEKLFYNALPLSLAGEVLLLFAGSEPVYIAAMCLLFAGIALYAAIFASYIGERLGKDGVKKGFLIMAGAILLFAVGALTRASLLTAILLGPVLCGLVELTLAVVRAAHHELNTDWEDSDWSAYPRPQMRRDSYLCLNGIWDLNGKEIRVPFAPQAPLSGYTDPAPKQMTYTKQIVIPADFQKKETDRILLHFGAVDQIADVLVDGKPACHHEGGYLPFTADVTDLLQDGTAGAHTITVLARDALDRNYPYGKQSKRRGGMWYTPVSGIWQTVWMEAVPKTHIESLTITPDPDGKVHIAAAMAGGGDCSCRLTIDCGDREEELVSGQPDFTVDMSAVTTPRLWCPEDPWLYNFTLSVEADGVCIDQVASYFALRTIEVRKVGDYQRIFLNGKPVFLNGLLDQGYYPDGLFLPADEAGYAFDIRAMKDLGFNLLRKHIKVEPEQFYYDCDRLGMLVMQDMVNSGRYSFFWETALPTVGQLGKDDTRRFYAGERKAFFERHAEDIVRGLYNHPCIVAYTVFNEGWGQYDSDRITEALKEIDPTRLYDSTSGWFAQKGSDFDSRHLYFDQTPVTAGDKALIISECGGFSRRIEGHTYAKYAEYGYGGCADEAALTQRTADMYEKLVLPSIATGLCGCIYTQVSDVEDEVNGIYTYDRKICKFHAAKIQEVNSKLYAEYALAAQAE